MGCKYQVSSLGATEARFEWKISGSSEQMGSMERQKEGQLGEPVSTPVNTARTSNGVSLI